MEKQIKAGDKVKSLIDGWDLRKGAVYTVKVVDRGGHVVVFDDAGDAQDLYPQECELVQPEQATFKVGDFVTPIAAQVGFSVARKYLVTGATSGTLYVIDDDGEERYRPIEQFMLVQSGTVVLDEKPAEIFLISGYASEFPTLEAAEQHLKDGYGVGGEEYRIAKLVRTVKVSRVVTVSLEDA